MWSGFGNIQKKNGYETSLKVIYILYPTVIIIIILISLHKRKNNLEAVAICSGVATQPPPLTALLKYEIIKLGMFHIQTPPCFLAVASLVNLSTTQLVSLYLCLNFT